MSTFVVTCTFRPNTDMSEASRLIPEERAQVEVLRGEGRLGVLFVSLERSTVFLEVNAQDTAEAEATARSLPLARFWDLDVYPIVGPAPRPGQPG